MNYATSPLFVVSPAAPKIRFNNLARMNRYVRLDETIVDLLMFFLTPAPLESASEAGFSDDVIGAALHEGFILPEASAEYVNAESWETHRWTRAAYLLYSQMNLDYAERNASSESLGELIDQRRESIARYAQEQEYPQRLWAENRASIALPCPSETEPTVDFEAALRRRSARGFSREDIGLDAFSASLFHATGNIREAEDSKKGGDPYFLLNSFYSWLHLFVAVQGVDGVPRGLYQYDPFGHRLLEIRKGVRDAEIVDCIQGQYWINGGGFCVFVGVQWERYFWVYRHSRAYINLLIQIGEISQELLMQCYPRGLGGWMTPAVTESAAKHLFGLPSETLQLMFFMKFGVPVDKVNPRLR